MLRLRTLGGTHVADATGDPLGGAASQRRLQALLAVLAVAGESGLSRDKLIALLWPEAEEERARHSLTQALYAARRALGADDLFLLTGDVRLNRERLGSDVQEFEAALASDELERAVALYQGPFLDGFFLPGSTEFEQWCSAQRQRFEDRAVSALERLARSAEDAGELREALDWRRRLAAIRPLDASVAVSLMTLLAQTGDRAGALQHARLHETLLRDQLGLDPDPVVSSLATRLREPVDWQPEGMPVVAGTATATAAAATTFAPPAPPGLLLGPAPAVPSTDDDLVDESAEEAAATTGGAPPRPEPLVRTLDLAAGPVRVVPAPGRRRLGTHARVVGLVLVLCALIAGLAWWRTEPPPAPVVEAPSLEQRVVVAPFRVTGASASLGYLRDGLVELLAARLADDSGARSVDAGAVLAAWRAAGLTGSGEVPRDTIVRLAARLGAERVVIGSVVGTPSRVVVNAVVVAVPSGEASGEASVEGPADSVTALVDRLAARLLVMGAGEDASLASQTTGSLRALRAFLDGQAAFRRSSHAVAVRRYEEALQLDSTFALAALQLARAADRLHWSAPRTRALAVAWRERDALDERAGALLLAMAGPRYPAPSSPEEQLAAWERLIDLTPDRAEPWFEMAARLLHDGASAGVADARARALVAVRRALTLEPTYAPARELLALMDASAAGGPPGAPPVDDRLPLAPFLRWRTALARGDQPALREVRATLAQLGPTNLRAIALAGQQDAVALDDARRAVRQLVARGGRPAERVDALLADHALALNEGRLRDALAATERLAELRPGTRAHLRLRVLDALYGGGRADDAAARALQRVADAPPASDPAARAMQLADACVVAQWRLSRGDTTGVRPAIDRLRGEPLRIPLAAPPAGTSGVACALLLEAALAVERRAPDAAGLVARLDSLAFTAGASGDAVTYAPILIARLHARLGDTRAAYDAVRRRAYVSGWPRYLASALRDEGRYAAALGAMDSARAAWERFLALRADADLELRPQVDEVRAALSAP